MWSCFRQKGHLARREEGASPQRAVTDEQRSPDGLFLENPEGGGSFCRDLRWLGCRSPLRGCSSLTALVAAKIPRRRTAYNFKTRSLVSGKMLLQTSPKSFGRVANLPCSRLVPPKI